MIDSKITDAFIGSCTGSKLVDIAMAAKVLEGRKVSKDVRLVVQTSSRRVFEDAERLGYLDIIRNSSAGGNVEIHPTGCGACVNFGPGAVEKGHRTISSSNRNFPGRMGKGESFLANPAVVAASAVKGEIISPLYLDQI